MFGALIRSGTVIIFATCNGAKLHYMHTAGYADQRQGESNEGWRWTGRGGIGVGKEGLIPAFEETKGRKTGGKKAAGAGGGGGGGGSE